MHRSAGAKWENWELGFGAWGAMISAMAMAKELGHPERPRERERKTERERR
jgi:hypothetical protein